MTDAEAACVLANKYDKLSHEGNGLVLIISWMMSYCDKVYIKDVCKWPGTVFGKC